MPLRWATLCVLGLWIACQGAGDDDGVDPPPDARPAAPCLDEVGVLCTVAGTGANGFSGDGGDARDAGAQAAPGGRLTLAGDGTLYVSDPQSGRVRATIRTAW